MIMAFIGYLGHRVCIFNWESGPVLTELAEAIAWYAAPGWDWFCSLPFDVHLYSEAIEAKLEMHLCWSHTPDSPIPKREKESDESCTSQLYYWNVHCLVVTCRVNSTRPMSGHKQLSSAVCSWRPCSTSVEWFGIQTVDHKTWQLVKM